MSRLIYCRLCAHSYEQVAGALPDYCPTCERPAQWSTEPVPTKRYTLTRNDCSFLHSIRVLPEADG